MRRKFNFLNTLPVFVAMILAIILILYVTSASGQGTVADLLRKTTGNDLRRLHSMLTTDYPENYNSGPGLLGIPYVTNWDKRRLEIMKNGRAVIEQDRTPLIFYRDLVDTTPYVAPNGNTFYTFGWCSEREMAFSSAAWLLGYEPQIIVQGSHAFTLVTIDATLYKVDNTYGYFTPWDYGYIPQPETKLELWYNRTAEQQAWELESILVEEESWMRIESQVEDYLYR